MGRDEFDVDARMHPRLRRVLQGLIALVLLALLAGTGLWIHQWWNEHSQARHLAQAEQEQREVLQGALHRQAPQWEERADTLEEQIAALQELLAAEMAQTLDNETPGKVAALQAATLDQFRTAAELDRELDRLARHTRELLAASGELAGPRGALHGIYGPRILTLRQRQAGLNARFSTLQESLGELEAASQARQDRIRKIADASHKDYAKGHAVGRHHYSPNGKVMYPRFNGTGAVRVHEEAQEQAAPQRRVYKLPEVW